jgi:hypothetical protein
MEGPRRRNVGSVIGDAFLTWGANFVPLTVLNAVCSAPLALFLLFGPPQADVLTWASTFWGLLGSFAAAGTSAYPVVKTLRGESASFGEAVLPGLRKLPALLGMAVVLAIPVLGLIIVALVASLAAVAAVAGSPDVSPLFPMLVLFGVYVVGAFPLAAYFVAHAVSGPALVVENLRITAAMYRSRRLTQGRRWAVLGTLIVVFVLSVVAHLLVSLPFGFELRRTVDAHRTSLLVGLAASTVFNSLGGACAAVIYNDLCREKDGVAEGDLQTTFG